MGEWRRPVPRQSTEKRLRGATGSTEKPAGPFTGDSFLSPRKLLEECNDRGVSPETQ